ncbi:hypothetical protein [Kitasatospora sp. NPDC087314]|uniref:hypothetical protein n=1 Tax=Kitasatospora sp. NPDC087314 TaxID=3364068 RepID=UPI0037F54716
MAVRGPRFRLRDTSVRVPETVPPRGATGLVGEPDDDRAMPLADVVSQPVEALGSDAEEVAVDAARIHRDNAGPDEHAYVTELNTAMARILWLGPVFKPRRSSRARSSAGPITVRTDGPSP